MSACGLRPPQAPRFEKVDNLEISRLNKARTTIRIDLQLYNPNKGRVTIREIEGRAWLQGRPLGEFRADTSIRVKGPGTIRLPVVLELDNSRILSHSLEALLAPSLKLDVKGKARAGKAGLFIQVPLDFSSELKPDQLGF